MSAKTLTHDIDPTPAKSLRERISAWVWPALLLLAFAPTMAWMWERFTIDIWQSGHGVLMPFVLVWLTVSRLRASRVEGRRSSALGFVFLCAGLGMLAIDQPIRTNMLAAAGLVTCLPGLSLLLLGRERTAELWFPLLISPLLIPFPAGTVSVIQNGMMDISARGAAWIISLSGMPVARDELLIRTGPHAFQVAPQCSGMNTLFAALVLALVLASFLRHWPRRIALLAIAAPLVAACNSLRVAVLIVLSAQYGVQAILRSWIHEATGIASFVVVFVVLALIAGRGVSAKAA